MSIGNCQNENCKLTVSTESNFFKGAGGLLLLVTPYPTMRASLVDILTDSASAFCSSVLAEPDSARNLLVKVVVELNL